MILQRIIMANAETLAANIIGRGETQIHYGNQVLLKVALKSLNSFYLNFMQNVLVVSPTKISLF